MKKTRKYYCKKEREESARIHCITVYMINIEESGGAAKVAARSIGRARESEREREEDLDARVYYSVLCYV